MVNKHFVCLWLHFCLPNKAAQQQRNSEQCLIPSARTENARWTLGTLTQTGAAPQQPPLSPQWKKVLLRSPHTAASDYAHSWWAQLPVLQQGDPAKPTGKGATLVPLRKRSSYWGGEKNPDTTEVNDSHFCRYTLDQNTKNSIHLHRQTMLL